MGTYHLLARDESHDLVKDGAAPRPTYLLQDGAAVCSLYFYDSALDGGRHAKHERVWAVSRGAVGARPFFLVSRVDAPQPTLLGRSWEVFSVTRSKYEAERAVHAACTAKPPAAPGPPLTHPPTLAPGAPGADLVPLGVEPVAPRATPVPSPRTPAPTPASTLDPSISALQLAIAVRRHRGRGLVDAQLRKLKRALAAACGLSTVHRVHLVGVAQLREPRAIAKVPEPAVVPYDQVTFQLVLDDVVADDGAVPFNNGVFQTLARRRAFAARLRHFLRGFGRSRISRLVRSYSH
jgi:hypothetical protein